MPASSSTVPMERLVELPEFHHPVVSPDGSRVAFYYDGTGRNELHTLDRETGEREQISNGEVPRDASWWVQWSEDGERVFFHRDQDGDERHDIAAITTRGEVETVVSFDGQARLVDAASTEDALLFRSDHEGQMNLYWQSGHGEDRRKLTAYDRPVRSASLSPDDESVAYVTNESSTSSNLDAYVMDDDGSGARRLELGTDGSHTYVGDWFPDGERLLVSDDSADLRRVGIYDLGTDSVDWLTPPEAHEQAAAVSPTGRYVLATRKRRAATAAVVYDLAAGEGRELALPEGVTEFTGAGSQVFADDDTVVLTHSTASDRRRLVEYDLETDETRVLLDAEYGDVDPDVFVDAEYVSYESEGGLEIGGLLFDPRDGPAVEAGATGIPGVVFVHGGPHFRISRAFTIHIQFLVARGYAVFAPNYRGSTGRGRAFRNAIHDDWGGKEQVDVARAGEWLAGRDWVDEDRVAVFGGSFGGFTVYSQLTCFPDPWATGVAWAGFTDLHRLYESDMPLYRHMLRTQMGDPEDDHDRWRERSPIEHVDGLEAPICILHGENDSRCPVEQARLFRDALLERGWQEGEDFAYHELPDEGHGSTDARKQVRAFGHVAEYLDRTL